MLKLLRTFLRDETGAITVDWVVLTAGIVTIATLVGYSLRDTTIETAEVIGTEIATRFEQ